MQGLVNDQCVFILGGIYSMANNAMRTFHTDGTKLELLVRESTSQPHVKENNESYITASA